MFKTKPFPESPSPILEAEVAELLDKEAIQEIPWRTGILLCNIFIIPNRRGIKDSN